MTRRDWLDVLGILCMLPLLLAIGLACVRRTRVGAAAPAERVRPR